MYHILLFFFFLSFKTDEIDFLSLLLYNLYNYNIIFVTYYRVI